MQKIYLATHNHHKKREFQVLFDRLLPGQFECHGLEDFPGLNWEENGVTFKENARIKAEVVSEAIAGKVDPASWILADDSGLCVDVLNGAPGVYSARYAGVNATDAQNRRKLTEELAARSGVFFEACFQCVLALISPKKEIYFFEGKCFGRIQKKSETENDLKSFGYDPLFIPTGFKNTFAEMTDQDKNSVSHRGLAMSRLVLEFQKSLKF